MALKFDLGTFTPSESLWNMNVGRTCTFMFSTRAVLVTKQTYLKSLEIDKHRRTDYRYSHQAGESEREFSQCLMNVCVPTSVTLFGCSLTGGKRRSARSPESGYSDGALERRQLASRWEDNGSSFFCHALLCVDFLLLFVRLHSQCWASQHCSGRKIPHTYIHVFLWLDSFLGIFFSSLSKGEKLLHACSAPRPSVQMPGLYWPGEARSCWGWQAVHFHAIAHLWRCNVKS